MKDLAYQSLRFAAVGLINTVFGLAAIYSLMYFGGVGPALSNAAGYAIGLLISFALNRVWTFRSDRPVVHVLPKYLATAAVCYLLNLSAVIAGTAYLSLSPYFVQLTGVSVYTVSMFIGCRWFVFNRSRVV